MLLYKPLRKHTHTTAIPTEGHTAQLEQIKHEASQEAIHPPGHQDGATADLLLSLVCIQTIQRPLPYQPTRKDFLVFLILANTSTHSLQHSTIATI